MTPLENFYHQQTEPNKSCLLALREIILSQHADIESVWKYGLPFFYFKGKMFCYLWIHKKYKQPYIGIVKGNQIEHPNLLLEKRKQIKILLVNPEEDFEIDFINEILQKAIKLYK